MNTYENERSEVISEERPPTLADSAPAAHEGPATRRCAHHWIIEPANGPVSRGVCQTCKEIKDFKNFADDFETAFD